MTKSKVNNIPPKLIFSRDYNISNWCYMENDVMEAAEEADIPRNDYGDPVEGHFKVMLIWESDGN